MVERVAQHRHCRNCERAVPYKEEFCGDECREDWTGKMRKKKNQLTLFYIVMVIVMILAMVLLMAG